MIILLIIVDCLWSQWTKWTACDCNVWKIGGNQDVFKYRTVFQSRYRAIHENEDEKWKAMVFADRFNEFSDSYGSFGFCITIIGIQKVKRVFFYIPKYC